VVAVAVVAVAVAVAVVAVLPLPLLLLPLLPASQESCHASYTTFPSPGIHRTVFETHPDRVTIEGPTLY